MEKSVVFELAWLPYALVLPQIAVTLVFFFWPARQAMCWSLLMQDAFATATQFVWLENFHDAVPRPALPRVVQGHGAVLACWSRCIGLAVSLLLAVFADRVMRGAHVYRTLLIWPYAVAPAVAGVLWLFMLVAHASAWSAYALREHGRRLELAAPRRPGACC